MPIRAVSLSDPLSQALDAAFADYWDEDAQYRARLRRIVQSIVAALQEGRDLEVYAQIYVGFWHKVYWFTPHGALKSDTCGASVWDTARSRGHVAYLHLTRVPMRSVLENWDAGGLWEQRRPIDAVLLHAWQECRGGAYYAKNMRINRKGCE